MLKKVIQKKREVKKNRKGLNKNNYPNDNPH